MSILFASVSFGQMIIVSHSLSLQDNSKVINHILKHASHRNGISSYMFDKWLFHYIVDDNYMFLCQADFNLERKIALQFLSDVKERFYTQYGKRLPQDSKFEACDFETFLHQQMVGIQCSAVSIDKTVSDVDLLKQSVEQTIDEFLASQDTVELLVDDIENDENQWWKKQRDKSRSEAQKKRRRKAQCKALIIIFVILSFIGTACLWGWARRSHSSGK
ncbi:vesicle-associated membrane protein 7A [Monocercomonoides exilis]|uniref:vesicle-associated membrane protein 7A n=1 Tax=Monocercomonoides exilis TaxID=2049356 RepID=UPI00355A07E4|nr:vesicle-associated membrane protein 7A [Monocercomonoides exilis]|eukprot:MONOS_5393.1-p1 / transcript=MONOS_5393.1 / gene=MONOS_5393 / organism=Monocercomonoides_exilis_PA203 / gene_product= vesicle-associated membrane protein 7A / transcript_product= vesicle-associated membrane protein 7A / location=Mono_scaffold00156:32180-32988(-) / protein_length=218 / sequence_SO=supercontig / SO=protein_coding / is_pseudo=false